MKDTFNTVRSVANCCLGAGFLEGRVRVSVKGFHFKPKIFTIFFVLVVSSYVACSRGEEPHEYRLYLLSGREAPEGKSNRTRR